MPELSRDQLLQPLEPGAEHHGGQRMAGRQGSVGHLKQAIQA
ncbi:MAG: hypothetical protein ACREN8_11660 [Candidatus Dormibacteraceae bacterium]